MHAFRGEVELGSNTLRCIDEVEMDDPDAGHLSTDGRVEVTFNQGRVSSVMVTGKQKWLSMDGTTLVSDGISWIEPSKIKFSRGSEQVFLHDAKGTMGANEAIVLLNSDREVEKVLLSGEVMIENNFGVQKSHPQIVLADRATYEPKDKRLHLEAEPANRVIYCDRLNNFTLSAPAIKAILDQEHRQRIEGVGDVRFDLAESEWEQVKKRFSLK
jgi:hypothetical protein